MKPLRPIPFGDFTPDLPEFENGGGSVNIKNVLPSAQGYRPMPGPTVFGDALTARCQGAITATQNNGTVRTYAGDVTNLYRLVDGVWTDASGTTYSCPSDAAWEFVKFKEQIIAANISDAVQEVALGSSTFADLFTSTLKPKAAHIGTTDDFLICGNVDEGGTIYPGRVRWSALDDITDMDQDAATQSDFQDYPEFGAVQAIRGFGRDAVVFQETAVRTLRYEGTPTVFRADVLEQGRGAVSPQSVISFGRFTFYLSVDGFYMFDGGQSHPIGAEKVDNWFYDNADAQYIRSATFGAIDPSRALVMWAFRSNSATPSAPLCDRILAYSWVTKKWTLIETTTECLFNDLSKGVTLEGLDDLFSTLEDVTPSMDDRFWAGGLALLSGFDSSHQLINYNGDALTAELDTKEIQHHPGRMSFVDAVRPLVEGTDATITVTPITRDKLNEAATVGTAESLNGIGEADPRSVARFHRYRIGIADGFDHAQGVQVESQPWGRQ